MLGMAEVSVSHIPTPLFPNRTYGLRQKIMNATRELQEMLDCSKEDIITSSGGYATEEKKHLRWGSKDGYILFITFSSSIRVTQMSA